MIGIAVNVVLVGIVLSAIGYVAYCYITAPKTMVVNSLEPEKPAITRPATIMDKLSYATKKSATLFVNLATAVALGLGKIIMDFADFLGAPELRAWITDHMSPEVGGIAILVILLLTTWARMRNSMGV